MSRSPGRRSGPGGRLEFAVGNEIGQGNQALRAPAENGERSGRLIELTNFITHRKF